MRRRTQILTVSVGINDELFWTQFQAWLALQAASVLIIALALSLAAAILLCSKVRGFENMAVICTKQVYYNYGRPACNAV